MGASNVALVYANWAGLPHVPFRVLAYMGLVTLDNADPPRYYAGVEPLSIALGRPECSHNDRKAVSDALTFLRKAGAIESLVKGSRGHRAEYVLRLVPVQGVLWTTPDEEASKPVVRGRKHHVQPDESTTFNVTKHHVQRDKAPRSTWSPGGLGGEGTEGGTTSPQVPTSPAPALGPVDNHDLDECPGCRFQRWEGKHAAGCPCAGRPWPLADVIPLRARA